MTDNQPSIENELLEISSLPKVLEDLNEAIKSEEILKSKLSSDEYSKIQNILKKVIKRTLLTGYILGKTEEAEEVSKIFQDVGK
jgi:hypothetical protein